MNEFLENQQNKIQLLENLASYQPHSIRSYTKQIQYTQMCGMHACTYACMHVHTLGLGDMAILVLDISYRKILRFSQKPVD